MSPGVGGFVCMGWKVDILLFVAPFGAPLVAQMVKNLPAVWEHASGEGERVIAPEPW